MGKVKRNLPSVGNSDFNWDMYEDGWNGKSLKVNDKIKTNEKGFKVYCHESYAQDLYYKYSNTAAPASKELQKNVLVQIDDLIPATKDKVLASINGGSNNIVIDLNKETKFFGTINMGENALTKESFLACLKDPEVKKAILDMGLVAKVGTDVEKASIWDGYVENLSTEMKQQVRLNSKAYIAKILSCNNGGYVVEVANTVKAFMPGSMAAANKLTNYAELVGKEMEVMVESYDEKLGFVVSRKKYLHTITPMYMKQLADKFAEDKDTVFEGTITGTTPFGIFIELKNFGGCVTGMIHKSLMSDNLRDALRQNNVEANTDIQVYVHKIENGRAIFTDVHSSEREVVIAKREAEDAKEKSTYVNAKKEARQPRQAANEQPANDAEVAVETTEVAEA